MQSRSRSRASSAPRRQLPRRLDRAPLRERRARRDRALDRHPHHRRADAADADRLSKNPLGVYVHAINWSKELGNDAHPQASAPALPLHARRSVVRIAGLLIGSAGSRLAHKVIRRRSPTTTRSRPCCRPTRRTPVEIVELPKPLPLPGQLKPLAGREERRRSRRIRTQRVDQANAAARVQPTRNGYHQRHPGLSVLATARSIRSMPRPARSPTSRSQPASSSSAPARSPPATPCAGSSATPKAAPAPAKRVHILVKPTRPDLVTNLVINTDRRTYHLELRSTEKTYMASVSWHYPQDQLIALRRQNAAAEAARPSPPASTSLRSTSATRSRATSRRGGRCAPSMTAPRSSSSSRRHRPGRDAAALRHRPGRRRRARQLPRPAATTSSSTGCSPPPSSGSAASSSRRPHRPHRREAAVVTTMATQRAHPTTVGSARPAAAARERPRVTRLSRKVLIGLGAVGLAVAGALFFALQTRHGVDQAAEELYKHRQPHHARRARRTAPRLHRPAARRCRSAAAARRSRPADPQCRSRGQPDPPTAARRARSTSRRRCAGDRGGAHQPPLRHDQLSAAPIAACADAAADAISGTDAAAPANAPPLDPDSAQNMQDRKLAFLNGASIAAPSAPIGLRTAASPYVVQAGTVIPAALITGIRSDLPGQITAQVTETCLRQPDRQIPAHPARRAPDRPVRQPDRVRAVARPARLEPPHHAERQLDRAGAPARRRRARVCRAGGRGRQSLGDLVKAARSPPCSASAPNSDQATKKAISSRRSVAAPRIRQPDRPAGRAPPAQRPADAHHPAGFPGARDRHPRSRARALRSGGKSMTKLKLGTIEDDKPVKLTVELPAAVHRDLVAYAEAIGREGGQAPPDPAKLIARDDREVHGDGQSIC